MTVAEFKQGRRANMEETGNQKNYSRSVEAMERKKEYMRCEEGKVICLNG